MAAFRFTFIVPVVMSLMPAIAWAQTGSVNGTVVDVQGAVVVNADVTLVPASRPTLTRRTGADGAFMFDQVLPGEYVLQAEAAGFVQSRQRVTVGTMNTTVTVTLQVAGITEDVSVVGSLPRSLERPTLTGTRLGLTLLETPASVHIVSGDAIRERGDASIAEAKSRAVGVTAQPTVGNGGGGLAARGFSGVGSVMQLYDGAQFFVASGTVSFPFDPWTVDRIEVLGGPASVLYGNGAIGGVVNVVPRKPNPSAFENGVRLSAGAYNTWRGAFDSAGPINDRTSYRVDVSYNRTDGWMQRGEADSTAVSVSLRRQVTPTLSLTLSEDYGYQRPDTYFGVPTMNGRPDKSRRTINYNVADADVKYKDNWTQLRAEWQPSVNVRLRTGAHYLTTDRFWRNLETYTVLPDLSVRRTGYLEIFHDQRQYGTRTDAVFNGSLFGRSNTLSAGFDYNRIRFQHTNNGPFTGTSIVSLDNPVPGAFLNVAGTSPRFRTHSHQAAIFAEDRLVLTSRFSVVGGIRLDHHQVDRLDLVARTTSERTFTPTSARGGIVYAARPGLSVYGQYATATESIGNIISQSAAQHVFDLSTGRQVEGGAKQVFWSGRGDWTIAAYRIVKEKLLAPDPNNLGQSLQIGQQSSRGIEATVGVTVGDVRIDANGTLLKARFDDFAENVRGVLTSRVGNVPPNVPERAGNLWVTWDALSNLQLRGGLRYVGERFWNNANTNKAPSYTVVDAGVRRRLTDRMAVDVRVNNLFDEFYAHSFGGGNSAAPQWMLGSPRTAEVALTANF